MKKNKERKSWPWTDGSPTALLPIEYLLYWGEKRGYTNIFFHPPRAKANFGSCPTPFRRIRLDKSKFIHRIGPQIISIGIGILFVFQFPLLALSWCRSASWSIWKLIFHFDRSLINWLFDLRSPMIIRRGPGSAGLRTRNDLYSDKHLLTLTLSSRMIIGFRSI